jgi:hypothetical protein
MSIKVKVLISSNKTQIQELNRLVDFWLESSIPYEIDKIQLSDLMGYKMIQKLLKVLSLYLQIRRESFVLIINTERLSGIEGLVLHTLAKVAKKVICYQISKPNEAFDKNYKRITQASRPKLYTLFLKALYPTNFRNDLSFFGAKEVLIKYFTHTKLSNPWIEGSTLIDEFWLHDEYSRSLFKSSGKELSVIGSVQKHQLFTSNRLVKTKGKLAFAVPHLAEHKLMSFEEAKSELSILKSVFESFEESLTFVACLHPKQDINNYSWLVGKNITISQFPLLNEIIDSECLICAFQSVTDWSRLLKIPTIQLDYLAHGLGIQAEGVFNVHNVEDLRRYLELLVNENLELNCIPRELLPFDSDIGKRITKRIETIIKLKD